MSTYTKATPSAIPRANRAASPAAIGPRPTKASLLRASQIKEGITVDKQKGVVIQQRPEIKKAGRPAGGETKRKVYAGLGGKKVAEEVGKVIGKAAKGVGAPAEPKVVSFYEAWVKKADSSLQPKKKVRFSANGAVRVYEPDAGEKTAWRLPEHYCENGEAVVAEAKAWLREIEDPNETSEKGYLRMRENRFKAIRFDQEFDDLKAKKAWEVVESAAMFYLDELVAEEKANLEKTNWSIYIFGGNPMLEDEPMPFEMEGDEDFDGIMDDLIVLQEMDEERRVVGEMADALAIILDEELAEDEADEDYLPALFLYGPNPSLMDEPMPFALPQPHPDTTFELADLSVLPSDDMSMLLDEEAPPNVPDPRANLPNLWVPEPRPEDFRDMAMDLDALADQGIMASDSDFDLCQRLQRGLTAFISTAE